jgi:hypothetical protein
MSLQPESHDETAVLADSAWARLHTVCLSGVCGVPDDADSAALVAAGFVRPTPGGLVALPEGRAAIEQWARMTEGSKAHLAVQRAGATFRPLDTRLNEVVSEWQRQGAAREQQLDLDASEIFTRLRAIDQQIATALDPLERDALRFAGYRPRLRNALQLIEAGHPEYLAGVMVDSYYTVWWHLNQDLAWALGVED